MEHSSRGSSFRKKSSWVTMNPVPEKKKKQEPTLSMVPSIGPNVFLSTTAEGEKIYFLFNEKTKTFVRYYPPFTIPTAPILPLFSRFCTTRKCMAVFAKEEESGLIKTYQFTESREFVAFSCSCDGCTDVQPESDLDPRREPPGYLAALKCHFEPILCIETVFNELGTEGKLSTFVDMDGYIGKYRPNARTGLWDLYERNTNVRTLSTRQRSPTPLFDNQLILLYYKWCPHKGTFIYYCSVVGQEEVEQIVFNDYRMQFERVKCDNCPYDKKSEMKPLFGGSMFVHSFITARTNMHVVVGAKEPDNRLQWGIFSPLDNGYREQSVEVLDLVKLSDFELRRQEMDAADPSRRAIKSAWFKDRSTGLVNSVFWIDKALDETVYWFCDAAGTIRPYILFQHVQLSGLGVFRALTPACLKSLRAEKEALLCKPLVEDKAGSEEDQKSSEAGESDASTRGDTTPSGPNPEDNFELMDLRFSALAEMQKYLRGVPVKASTFIFDTLNRDQSTGQMYQQQPPRYSSQPPQCQTYQPLYQGQQPQYYGQPLFQGQPQYQGQQPQYYGQPQYQGQLQYQGLPQYYGLPQSQQYRTQPQLPTQSSIPVQPQYQYPVPAPFQVQPYYYGQSRNPAQPPQQPQAQASAPAAGGQTPQNQQPEMPLPKPIMIKDMEAEMLPFAELSLSDEERTAASELPKGDSSSGTAKNVTLAEAAAERKKAMSKMIAELCDYANIDFSAPTLATAARLQEDILKYYQSHGNTKKKQSKEVQEALLPAKMRVLKRRQSGTAPCHGPAAVSPSILDDMIVVSDDEIPSTSSSK